jgi:molybdate transport system regulatory protein
LEAIGEHGSITAAAKAVGLSYKGAWDAVDAMNNQACTALVSRSVGGSQGGGTQLTEYGKRVIQLVRRIEREYADVVHLLDAPTSELAEYGRLQRQLTFCTSARNQWIGRVTQVTLGMVRAEVTIALGEQALRSTVSVSSVQRLGIAPGVELCALVKATSVRLQLDGREAQGDQKDHAANRLRATVSGVSGGLDQLEVTARLEGERTITAVVPALRDGERLRKGTKVIASFAPEQVVLVQLQG